MLNISIPKPCHEDWNNMLPNEQGRHCNTCIKTVVDFTAMTDEEVKYFFINQQGKSVCGRFKNEQLQRIHITLPRNIYQITMPRWKQFLTALLLAFSSMLFSCDALVGQQDLVGVVMADVPQTGEIIPAAPPSAGNMQFPFDSTTQKPACSTLTGDTILIESIIQGDIEIKQGELIMQPVEPERPPAEEASQPGKVQQDTGERYFTGKPVYDSAAFRIHNQADSQKTGHPATIDPVNCDHQNNINL